MAVPAPEGRGSSRRGFFKALTAVIGGAIGAALAAPALAYLWFPVRRKVVVGADGFVPVAEEATVAPGSAPVRVAVVTPRQLDAWTEASRVRVGAAWLSRDEGGPVRALSATCPHLGCAVDYDPKGGVFRCPCHESAFARDGRRLDGPAKRDLDPLEVEVKDGRVGVKFERYELDVPERVKV